MELLLFILLSPLILWNNLTWNEELEAHWQATRQTYLEEDTFDYEAWNRLNYEQIAWWHQ